jgi:protocatechuate 3,4-dioxygenase beta subunit
VTVRGKVETEGTSPAPLEGARVVLGGKVTTTNDKGAFEFKDKQVTAVTRATVTVALTVSKDQYGTLLDDTVELTLGATKELETIRLPALPGTGSVAGKVVQSTDGAAVVNAKVTLGTGDYARSGRTDDNGLFQVSGVLTGEQPYRAEKTGFLPTTGVVDNVVQAQTTELPGSIRLVPSGAKVTVSGTVRDEDGNALAQATVKVGATSDQTDAQGRYDLASLSVGTQTLTASKDGFNDSAREVEVTGDQGEIDFVLFSSNEQGSLPGGPFNVTGKVVNGAGAPVAGATVTALTQGDQTEAARFVTGADGKYYLLVPAGGYTVRAEKSGQTATQAVTLPAGGQIVTGVNLTVG